MARCNMPKLEKYLPELNKKIDQDKNVRTQNDQETACSARWPPFKLQSEKSEDREIEKVSSKENCWSLYDILTKIKESLFTSVVQILSAEVLDSTTNWTNTVTGVACLTRTQENKYFLQVGLK